jgi:hypothetical protein
MVCNLPAFRFPLSAFRFRTRFRSGISVLEVLISIGVASVGLLGVILLIPLADHQMNRGLVLERSNQVGANAFREFEIIGADNPNLWRQLTGSAPAVIAPARMGVDPFSNQTEVRRAFCLDPAFVFFNGSSLGTNNEDPRVFPYPPHPNPTLKMPRITLPGITLGLLGDGQANPGVLSWAHADSLFTSHDDLVFRRDDTDRTLPPLQLNYDGSDWNPAGTPGVNERTRSARGRFSWIATIVPHEKVGPNGDEYILSIVVFHNRDSTFAMTPGADESANERVVQIPFDPSNSISGFISAGVGGGDVAIAPLPTALQPAEKELEVRAGDWVMLSRRNPYFKRFGQNNNPIYGDAPHTHRWYRVVSADSEILQPGPPYAPAGSWVRFVTLDGPDFEPYNFNDYPAPWNQGYNQATIVKNVAAVFEKTIRLDTSSLWMQ